MCIKNATLDEKKTLGTIYKLFAENVDSMLIQCNRTKLDLIDIVRQKIISIII